MQVKAFSILMLHAEYVGYLNRKICLPCLHVPMSLLCQPTDMHGLFMLLHMLPSTQAGKH